MLEFLKSLPPELGVLLTAMVPVVELRGSIFVGYAAGLNIFVTYILSVIGNLIPVPFILLFITKIITYLKTTRLFARPAHWLEARSEKKKGTIEKYSALGLFLFVAIPLPGTGAWTGCLIAALLGMRFKKAFPAVVAGVLCAGLIMTLLSYGAVDAVISLFQ